MSRTSRLSNIVFCAQGSALTIFEQLLPHLKDQLPIDTLGLLVSDQHYFGQLMSKPNSFNQHPSTLILKEWQLVAGAARTTLNQTKINQYEQRYGTPNLWPAIIADRRLSLGKNTKYTQDYTPRYTHTRMLCLLQHATEQIEQFLDQLNPQAVVGFNMVTLSEFLIYLIAKQKNIPYWQIKNAKIENFVTLFSDPLQLSQEITARAKTAIITDEIKTKAANYLTQAQSKQSTYEGHVILKPPTLAALANPNLPKKLAAAAVFDLTHKNKYRHDYHSAGLSAVWHFNILKPLKARQHHNFLSAHYLHPDQLPKTKYVFFPLHTEPEIALSIYGSHHQNQIEVVRNIAQSIPVTWQVIVKDHPRSLGIRSLQYYKKLLQISNVRLVNPYLPSYDIIEHAQAVTVITSWVGFEAVMSQKPVITLGETTFNALPNTMVVKNHSYQNLARDIEHAIRNHHYDEAEVIHHITTVMAISHPINLYSEILAKPGRHTTPISREDKRKAIQSFAEHIAIAVNNRN